MEAAGLGKNPLAPTELLKELEDDLEEPAGPTMMSKEARQLMLSGQGQAGLQAWKVNLSIPTHPLRGRPLPVNAFQTMFKHLPLVSTFLLSFVECMCMARSRTMRG